MSFFALKGQYILAQGKAEGVALGSMPPNESAALQGQGIAMIALPLQGGKIGGCHNPGRRRVRLALG